MFCSKCGKQISDQAKFCNYCGNPVNIAQPQTPPASQPVRQAAPSTKKKGKAGQIILRLVIVLTVYFSVRLITENVIAGKNRVDTPSNGQIVINSQDSTFEKGFKESLTEDQDVKDAMSSCFYGAIYENGTLRYGMTKLNVPGYTLLPGEGDERDWLMPPEGGCVLAAYKQLEIPNISYDASTEEGLLDSYKQSYSDVTMIDFQKIHVNGFPVIRYIISYSSEGLHQYQGELIVFPSETTDATIRLAMFVDTASGHGTDMINQVLDTLEVSPEFRVRMEEADEIGLNRITVK